MPGEGTKQMTVSEAGRKGGLTTLDRHGKDHLTKAGRQGGEATRAKHGPGHFAEIGRKGVEARRRNSAKADGG